MQTQEKLMSSHVLIIDDDAFSVHIMERILDHQDIIYTSIKDVSDLSKEIQYLGDIDMVLLDLEMPHLDGYEVLEILQQHFGEDLPIVACTGHTAEIHTTQRLGFFSFVTKPLDFERFSHQLRSMLNGVPIWEAR